MKPAYYFLTLLLLLASGFIFINLEKTQTPDSIASNENTKTPDEVATTTEDKINTYESEKKIDASPVITETKPALNKNMEKTVPLVENIEAKEPEPTNENSRMIANGEYADEVNSPNKNNDCDATCETAKLEPAEIADAAKINIPATGEFADQVNSDAIFAQAQQKDPGLQPEAKLADVPESSLPPTELGAYSPPQQE